MAHGKWVHRYAPRDEGLDGRLNSAGGTRDDRLGRAVLVRRHDVARNLCKHLLHGIDVRSDSCHPTLVVDLHACHLTSACAHSDESILEAQDPGRHRCRILAERVPGDHIGHDAMSREKTHQGDVNSQCRGLRYLSVPETLELLLFRKLWIASDEVCEGPTELLGHDLIGLVKGRLNDGILSREVESHVNVLRPLACEQERHLAIRRGLLDVDAAPAKHLHSAALPEDLERTLDLARLRLSVHRGSRQTNRSRRIIGSIGVALEGRNQARTIHGTQTPHRGGEGLIFEDGRRYRCGCCSLYRILAEIFLKDDVEICPAEAERAHTDAASRTIRPGLCIGLNLERYLIKRYV